MRVNELKLFPCPTKRGCQMNVMKHWHYFRFSHDVRFIQKGIIPPLKQSSKPFSDISRHGCFFFFLKVVYCVSDNIHSVCDGLFTHRAKCLLQGMGQWWVQKSCVFQKTGIVSSELTSSWMVFCANLAVCQGNSLFLVHVNLTSIMLKCWAF